MTKFKVETEMEDGWSRWVQPIMSGYKMACCDCGLVHNMEFQVLEVLRKNKDGTWKAVALDPVRYRVEFRARRNGRSTALMRRSKKNIE